MSITCPPTTDRTRAGELAHANVISLAMIKHWVCLRVVTECCWLRRVVGYGGLMVTEGTDGFWSIGWTVARYFEGRISKILSWSASTLFDDQ